MNAQRYVAPARHLPTGNGDDKRTQFTSTSVHTIQLTEETGDLDERGDVIFVPVGDVISLPLGTKEVYIQHRMCGDFYCFIEGSKMVAATGDTRNEAFTNALAKAA